MNTFAILLILNFFCLLCYSQTNTSSLNFISIVGSSKVAFSYIESTQELEIVLVTPTSQWVGIVFSGEMQGDAVIYCSGKSGNTFANVTFRDFYLSGSKSLSGVKYDSQQDWQELSQTTSNGKVTIVGRRKLFTGDSNDKSFNFNTTNSITFRAAYYKGSTILNKVHTDVSTSTYSYNVLTGSLTETSSVSKSVYLHGTLMWIAWALLCPLGILSSRNRFFFTKYQFKRNWFQFHRIFMISALVFAGLGFLVVIVHISNDNAKHFSNSHMILGLIVIIFAVLQPINAYFRPHPPSIEHPIKTIGRLTWEIIHKFNGYAVIFVLSQTAIFLGLKLIKVDTLLGLQIAWFILVIILGFSLEAYRYKNPEPNNVPLSTNNPTNPTSKGNDNGDVQKVEIETTNDTQN